MADSHRSSRAKELGKKSAVKNLLILSTSIFVTFTAYESVAVLQSTMNAKSGMGVVTQAVVYATGALFVILFPKYLNARFGIKNVLAFSTLGFVPYVAANLYPHWSTMVPSAAVLGCLSVLLMNSNLTYINDLAAIYSESENNRKEMFNVEKVSSSSECAPRTGSTTRMQEDDSYCDSTENSIPQVHCITGMQETDRDYGTFHEPFETFEAELSNGIPALVHRQNPCNFPLKDGIVLYTQKTFQSTTARFFAISFSFYSLSHVASSLLSYFILDIGRETYNVTANSSCRCGPNFVDSESDCLKYNVLEPSTELRYWLSGVGVFLLLVAFFLMLLLDPLKTDRERLGFTLDALLASARLFKNKKQLLLVPLTFFIGIEYAFYLGDFTKAFVSCSWGTHHVGLVHGFFGLAGFVSSFLSGYLVKHIGRLSIFLVNFGVTVVSFVYLFVWDPDWPHQYLFIGGTLFGVFNGVYMSQIRALYGYLFKEEEAAAFGNYLLVYDLGNTLSYAYSAYLYTYVKIYIMSAVLVLGMAGYIAVEVITMNTASSRKAPPRVVGTK